MTSLIADYEQQYSILTAEITAEIGILTRLPQGLGEFVYYFSVPYCFINF